MLVLVRPVGHKECRRGAINAGVERDVAGRGCPEDAPELLVRPAAESAGYALGVEED